MIKMNRKDILMNGFKSKIGFSFSHKDMQEFETIIDFYEKENKQLQNNWNELKKWLEEHWQESQDIWFVKIINKMQELEQGKDENNK